MVEENVADTTEEAASESEGTEDKETSAATTTEEALDADFVELDGVNYTAEQLREHVAASANKTSWQKTLKQREMDLAAKEKAPATTRRFPSPTRTEYSSLASKNIPDPDDDRQGFLRAQMAVRTQVDANAKMAHNIPDLVRAEVDKLRAEDANVRVASDIQTMEDKFRADHKELSDAEAKDVYDYVARKIVWRNPDGSVIPEAFEDGYLLLRAQNGGLQQDQLDAKEAGKREQREELNNRKGLRVLGGAKTSGGGVVRDANWWMSHPEEFDKLDQYEQDRISEEFMKDPAKQVTFYKQTIGA